MPEKKIRIEFRDHGGSKYTLSFEGRISKEKMSKIMTFCEVLEQTDSEQRLDLTLDTTFNKTLKLVEEKFELGSFTSSDLLEAYEDHYNTPMKLSTVSTYLVRLLERGYVRRERFGNSWTYRKVKVTLNQ